MNSLWDIRIFLGLVPKESPCIRISIRKVMYKIWSIKGTMGNFSFMANLLCLFSDSYLGQLKVIISMDTHISTRRRILDRRLPWTWRSSLEWVGRNLVGKMREGRLELVVWFCTLQNCDKRVFYAPCLLSVYKSVLCKAVHQTATEQLFNINSADNYGVACSV